MGKIIPFQRKKRCFSVKADGFVSVIAIDDIEDIALGKSSIAEFEKPEEFARTLAIIILDSLDDR